MTHPSRITPALEAGLFELPDGQVAVFDPPAGADLDPLPRDRTVLIQPFRPDHDAWQADGWTVAVTPPDAAALAIVFATRSREATRAAIAAAAGLSAGPVVVTGRKTDGIEGVLKELRGRGALSDALSKSHGKLAVFTPGDSLGDWAATPRLVDGFTVLPGVFSADGPDPASVALADALPPLKGRIVDLGAGWGYLSARLLGPETREIHLVEADSRALDCARQNVTDPRAVFHWADATRWGEAGAFDHVVTNPPFHNARRADPSLGAAFIRNAARLLTRGGTLWLVANRHLPYERTLTETFRSVDELPGTSSFKLFRVTHPIRGGNR